MARSETESALDLRAARMPCGEDPVAVPRGVDLALPREREDPERVVLVRRLVAVHAAHAAATTLHHLERHPECAEDLRPERRRPGDQRLLRAVRQEAKGAPLP